MKNIKEKAEIWTINSNSLFAVYESKEDENLFYICWTFLKGNNEENVLGKKGLETIFIRT